PIRSTGPFGASLSGFDFLQGRHLVDRMRGGTVDRLLEDPSVLSAEHDRSTGLHHGGRPVCPVCG
ncbi:hypothetical protein Dimus_031339, partial [Dionaea muscipula]